MKEKILVFLAISFLLLSIPQTYALSGSNICSVSPPASSVFGISPEYTAGFNYGCSTYFENFSTGGCGYGVIPQQIADKGGSFAQDWRDGCSFGKQHGEKILKTKTKLTGLSENVELPMFYCDQIVLEKQNFSPGAPLKFHYDIGCDMGFYAAVVDYDPNPITACKIRPQPIENNACIIGYQDGNSEGKKIVSVFSPLTLSEKNEADNNGCMNAYNPDWYKQGFIRSCNMAFADADIACDAGFFSEAYTSKMSKYNFAFKYGCQAGKSLGITARRKARLSSYDPETSGLVPDCDPTLPPGSPVNENGLGPCGLSAAEQLIKNIIKFLFWIVIPLAAIMIGLGGFTIMTAAGSPEKVKKGTGMITIALTGIAIMAVAYLIVQFVFGALGVSQTIVDDIFK